MDTPSRDSFDDVWHAFEFSAIEALLLRSFVEYLRSWPDPPEKKRARLENWRAEIGLQFGNPALIEPSKTLVQKLRDAPPEVRAVTLEGVLAAAHAMYFGEPGSKF